MGNARADFVGWSDTIRPQVSQPAPP